MANNLLNTDNPVETGIQPYLLICCRASQDRNFSLSQKPKPNIFFIAKRTSRRSADMFCCRCNLVFAKSWVR